MQQERLLLQRHDWQGVQEMQCAGVDRCWRRMGGGGGEVWCTLQQMMQCLRPAEEAARKDPLRLMLVKQRRGGAWGAQGWSGSEARGW